MAEDESVDEQPQTKGHGCSYLQGEVMRNPIRLLYSAAGLLTLVVAGGLMLQPTLLAEEDSERGEVRPEPEEAEKPDDMQPNGHWSIFQTDRGVIRMNTRTGDSWLLRGSETPEWVRVRDSRRDRADREKRMIESFTEGIILERRNDEAWKVTVDAEYRPELETFGLFKGDVIRAVDGKDPMTQSIPNAISEAWHERGYVVLRIKRNGQEFNLRVPFHE